MEKYDVIIVGGGASGLACAASFPESGLKILVIEAGERAGKKLAASGNGQGNVFNTDRDISHYHSGNLGLVKKIACAEDKPAEWACDKIFGAMLFKYGASGRAYPQSLQASSLTDILLKKLGKRGVEILLSTSVSSIGKDGSTFRVFCGEKTFSADFVVLATGGKAQKQFKTDGSAYALAQNFGHKITPLYPAIVQLKTDLSHIKNLKGVKAECFAEAISREGEKKSVSGDVIFTEYGVSGSAIFYLSSALCVSGGTLKIEFLPEISQNTLKETLYKRKNERVETCDLLSGLVHNRIARAVLLRAASEDIDKIVETLKNFTLDVKGTLGFDYAQVTRGGVDMREISDNLESKLVKNLYFTGEILDVDGDCGGYNLNWAFSSGIAVAEDIFQKISKNEAGNEEA